MGLWSKLFGEEKAKSEEPEPSPEASPDILDEEIPGSLDLGWYWSAEKQQLQMAKIAEEDRATHFYVIGATGTGKTKFLESLIEQDIEKGNGFGVIDPHGDLVEEIKGFLACRNFTFMDEGEICERVVLVDPTDPRSTVTFNPLEKLPNVSIPEQVAELVSSFKKIWSDSWGVRMEDLMRNSLIALGEAGLTLLELPSFLTKRPFRASVLTKVSHPIAQDYFQTRFDTLTDRGQVTWIEPVMNKVNAFLGFGALVGELEEALLPELGARGFRRKRGKGYLELSRKHPGAPLEESICLEELGPTEAAVVVYVSLTLFKEHPALLRCNIDWIQSRGSERRIDPLVARSLKVPESSQAIVELASGLARDVREVAVPFLTEEVNVEFLVNLLRAQVEHGLVQTSERGTGVLSRVLSMGHKPRKPRINWLYLGYLNGIRGEENQSRRDFEEYFRRAAGESGARTHAARVEGFWRSRFASEPPNTGCPSP